MNIVKPSKQENLELNIGDIIICPLTNNAYVLMIENYINKGDDTTLVAFKTLCGSYGMCGVKELKDMRRYIKEKVQYERYKHYSVKEFELKLVPREN